MPSFSNCSVKLQTAPSSAEFETFPSSSSLVAKLELQMLAIVLNFTFELLTVQDEKGQLALDVGKLRRKVVLT